MAALVTAALIQTPARAADEPRQGERDLTTLDLESLLNIRVTTASKFAEKLSEAPGVISVITRDELRRYGGLTLRKILERAPGLAGSTASFTDRSMVAARGDQMKINGGHVLFLVNGRPTREILEGGIVSDLLESFPVNVLERIEVIRGPGSVLYGSNAFSAVINLITREVNGNSLEITASGAGPGGAATTGAFTLQKGDFSIIGSGQFHQGPEWTPRVHSMIDGWRTPNLPDRGKGAYLGVNYQGFRLMSSFTEWKSAYIEGQMGEARWRRGFADLGYSFQPNPHWEMAFNVTYTRTTLNAESWIPFITRDSYEAVGEWSNHVHVSERDELTFGALYSHIQGQEIFLPSSLGLMISHGSRPGEAVYGQWDHRLSDQWKLIGGFQANKIGGQDFNVAPRAGVIWNPTPRYTVKALYSEAFRAPSLNETTLNYIPPPDVGGPSLIGNPNLEPETVSTVDLTVGYQGAHFETSAGYFHSLLKHNIIEANVTADGRYVNLGEARFSGAEVEGKYYLNRTVLLEGSALYQTNEDSEDHYTITPIPHFAAKAGVSYRSPGDWTAGLFDVYQGHISGYAHSTNPSPTAYHLLNGHFRYDFSKYLPANSKTGLALVIHADNLTNRPIWLPDWKDSPGDSIFYARGRTVYFGFEFSLGKD